MTKKMCGLLIILALLLPFSLMAQATQPATVSLAGKLRWVNDNQGQRATTYLMVAERVPGSGGQKQLLVPAKADGSPLHGAIAVDLSQSEFSHVFTGLPATRANGSAIDYTVVEARNPVGKPLLSAYADFDFLAPDGYLRSTEKQADGSILITNTRLVEQAPVKDGDHSKPCEINWYSQVIRGRTIYIEPTRYKVSPNYYPNTIDHPIKPSQGVLVTQSWPEDGWRTLFWRVIFATDNELHNATLTLDLSELTALGMVPQTNTQGYVSFGDAAANQAWLDRAGGGLDAAYMWRYKTMDASGLTGVLNADGKTVTVAIPKMDSHTIFIMSMVTKLSAATDYYLTPMDAQALDGARYAFSATLSAQTRCVHVQKTWEGETNGSEQVTIALTANGVSLVQLAEDRLMSELNKPFVSTTAANTAYDDLRKWVHEMDKAVPGFFSALAKHPQRPLLESNWVDWSNWPTKTYKNNSYVFDQAQLDWTLSMLKTFYQANLTKENGYQHTFAQLPWLTDAAYGVSEVVLPQGWTQSGEVAKEIDGQRILLNITNKGKSPASSYPPLHVPLTGKKTLQNGNLKAGEFSFELLDEQGQVLATVKNAADGSLVFPERTFSKEVSNYLYKIREVQGKDSKTTYDKTVYTVKVTTKAVDGKLEARVDVLKNGEPTAGGIQFLNIRVLPKTGDNLPVNLALLLGLSLLLAVTVLGLNKRTKNKARLH